MIEVASKSDNKPAHADACHKLGLLYNMDGKDKNTKKSLTFLEQHFEMLRQKSDDNEMIKDQKRIDLARVNIGIVEANKKMEDYQQLVLMPKNLIGLVEWKIKRDPKHFS